MKADRCPVCRRRHVRNSEQNRRLWALYHLISERVRPGGIQYSVESWHAYMKSRFLGCDDIVLPSKKVLTIPRSTAGLDVSEFSAYMDAVEAWAAERDIYLEDEVFA